MATRFEILFPSDDRGLIEFAHEALDEIRRLEAIMSYFDPESRVAELNRCAFERPVVVEPELFGLLDRCRQIWTETRGAFDVAAGAAWRCWGFDRRDGRVPDPSEIRAALSATGSDGLELDATDRTVRFLKSGLEVNLGSIGKGFALDRSGGILQNAGLEHALLHAGNSSFLAWGDPGGSGAGWKVAVRHPRRRDSDLLLLNLRNVGMATSGVGEQFFERDGRRYGHILDPREGIPVLHHLSVTTFAPDAALADALSTAFFVMRPDEIAAYCDTNAEVGVILVPGAEDGDRLEVRMFGTAESYLGRVCSD